MNNKVGHGPSAEWLRSRILYPLVIIAAAAGVVALLLNSSTSPDTSMKAADPIVVRSQTVTPGPVTLQVSSEGSTQAAVAATLVAQVGGGVTYIAPNLKTGGQFVTGDTLLRIDDRDFRAALTSAEAQLERARVESRFFAAEWQRLQALSKEKMVSESQLRNAERAAGVGRANVKDAQARQVKASLDLERTQIKAPFNGRVESERVDVGQFLQRGAEVAAIYGTDALEVRLPVADSQLAFLEPEILLSGNYATTASPKVVLEARYAGERQRWEAQLVRSEGLIDRKSRVVYLIARVIHTRSNRGVTLPAGLFVDATIQGISLTDVVKLPRSAIREQDQVLVIDENSALRFRSVEILRFQDGMALITQGLAAGERVCLSNLQFVVEGMLVAIAP